jgi:outer membrane protein assembly factor BamB
MTRLRTTLWATALGFLMAAPPSLAEGWNLQGGNARRTGQATVDGPQRGDRTWTYIARTGLSINMEPTATSFGVYFGTWGLVRKHGASRARWDRFDGTFAAVDRITGEPLFGPARPGVTPFAYNYPMRPPTRQDRDAGQGLHASWLNGTIEGSAASDPVNARLYFGRGDGHLYAIEGGTGELVWSYRSRAPGRDKDPEGGGQIVGGPVVTPAGTIVFATYATPLVPHPPRLIRHETNAVYGVDRDGKERWRYPRTGSLLNPFVAAPALSHDGSVAYLVTQRLDDRHPADVLAIEADTGLVKWHLPLPDSGGSDLAVGANGVLYVAGIGKRRFGAGPTVFAVRDDDTSGTLVWSTPLPGDGDLWSGGIALDEDGTSVRHVYASTTGPREVDTDGALHQLDPGTGAIRSGFEPAKATPEGRGGLTDPTLGADGTVYVGTRGRAAALFRDAVPARMYALRPAADGMAIVWSLAVSGSLHRSSPAIGPEGGLFFGTTGPLPAEQYLTPRDVGEIVEGADASLYGVRDLH